MTTSEELGILEDSKLGFGKNTSRRGPGRLGEDTEVSLNFVP